MRVLPEKLLAPARSEVALSPAARQPDAKLAERVAGLVEADVVAAGWPVGTLIGTEHQLAQHYRVSRAVAREAIRLIEHRQIARMRRGRHGGLVVVEPDASAVAESLSIYLEYIRVTAGDLYEARTVLELFSVTVAADRLDENQLLALRRAAESEDREDSGGGCGIQRIHQLIAEATGNTALSLFVQAAVSISGRHFSSALQGLPQTRNSNREVHRAHAAIVEAIVAGDGLLARHRMLKHMTALHQALSRIVAQQRRREARVGAAGPAASGNGAAARADQRPADLVADRIRGEIVRRGWPVGESLGFEAELMRRYGIGRAQFREAIRILENHAVVRMQRGAAGGMVVDAPDGAAVVRAMSLYLQQRGITPQHLHELREALETATVRLAIERLTAAGTGRLNAALERERDWPDEDFPAVSHDLHAIIAELSGNKTLSVLLSVLMHLTAQRLRGSRRGEVTDPPGAVRHAHRAIVEAMIAGDTPLAWRRMRIHLQALARWTRK